MKVLYYVLKPHHWWGMFVLGSASLVYGIRADVPFLAVGSGFLVALPVARAVLEVPEAFVRWTKRVRYAEWNGRHFVFNSTQVRVFWDDTVIWLHADDLFYALQQKHDPLAKRKIGARLGLEHFSIPKGTKDLCFSEDGIFRYLAGLSHDDAWRCKRWLQREVLPNIRKLREIGSGHYDQFELVAKDAEDSA